MVSLSLFHFLSSILSSYVKLKTLLTDEPKLNKEPTVQDLDDIEKNESVRSDIADALLGTRSRIVTLAGAPVPMGLYLVDYSLNYIEFRIYIIDNNLY